MLFHPGVRYVNTSAVQKKVSEKHFIARRMRNTFGTILAVTNFWLFFVVVVLFLGRMNSGWSVN